MARDRSAEIEAKLETVDISYFDEDPDDEVGRSGHGYYFQFAGEDDWNGAYDSHDEAEEEASDLVEAYYRDLDERLDRYSSAPVDGMTRFLAEFEPIAAKDHADLFFWPTSDGRYLTLVDARDAEVAGKLVVNEFGVAPIRIEAHPVTLDQFCADGTYPHPDPEPETAIPTP